MLNSQYKNWYKQFFSKYYLLFFATRKTYEQTKKEVKFICKVLNLKKNSEILDLACGQGRHTIELAKKKYKLTGLDFDRQSLKQALLSARLNKLNIDFIRCDMRAIPFQKKFDAVINMFSAFGYFIKENDNLKVLKEVTKSLKPYGLFLLDIPSKQYILHNKIKKWWDKIGQTYILEERIFDKNKNILINEIILFLPNKKVIRTRTVMHLYNLDEIKNKLKQCGLKPIQVWGNYNKDKFSSKKSKRMIVIAQKN